MHFNIRSLEAHFTDFCMLLDMLKQRGTELDIILLCETFCNKFNYNKFALDGFKHEPLYRKKMSKGGVSIFIRDTIEYKLRKDLSFFDEGIFESIFIELTEGGTIVGEVYRIPDKNPNIFLTNMESIISRIEAEHKICFIGTDQNLDLLKCEIHEPTNQLMNLNFQHAMLPLFYIPTRITHTSATLIDNIYTSSINCNFTTAVLYSDISDHLPLIVLLDKTTKTTTNSKYQNIQTRNLSNQNLSRIKESIGNYDWSVINELNCEDAYDHFVRTIKYNMDAIAPMQHKRVRIKQTNTHTWVTKGILVSSNKQIKLYKQSIGKDNNDPHVIAYKLYRNKLNRIKRIAKQLHYQKFFQDHYKDTRKIWTELNNLIGKSNNKNEIVDRFQFNGNILTNDKDIANGFCNFFSSVGNDTANKIPQSNKNPLNYIKDTVNKSFFFSPTTPDEITRLIATLKCKKSSGHDGLSNDLIKKFKNEISKPLSIIFNKSLIDGHFPSQMKVAKIIPIYKSKEKNDFTNYRPISLLPNFAKIFEKLVHIRLYSFLKQNHILSNKQYGFTPKSSTIDALTNFYGETLNYLDNNEQVLAVYCDLSKAFDTISHEILLKKLNCYGIRGLALQWFKSYLSGRKIYVSYKGVISNTNDISIGVPQGSVLGPLLFNVYINDLEHSLDKASAILYADDATVYLHHKSNKILFNTMNNELKQLSEWFKTNKLSLNTSKTKYMLIRNRGVFYGDEYTLNIDNRMIDRCKVFNFLGVNLDEYLLWNEHIKQLNQKLAYCTYSLKKVKYILSTENLIKLYYALFHSHLEYGMLLWCNTSMKNLNILQRMQKRVLRIIHKLPYNAPTEELFKTAKILNVNNCIDKQLLSFMYRYNTKELSLNIQNLYISNQEIHNYYTRQRNNPHIQKRNKQCTLNSFLHRAPLKWQNLPNQIKSKTSKISFNKRVKAFLLSN